MQLDLSTVCYSIWTQQGSGSIITNEDYLLKRYTTQYKNLLLAPGDNTFTFDNKVDEEHILAINFQRARLKEKLDPGNWELVSEVEGMILLTGGNYY